MLVEEVIKYFFLGILTATFRSYPPLFGRVTGQKAEPWKEPFDQLSASLQWIFFLKLHAFSFFPGKSFTIIPGHTSPP